MMQAMPRPYGSGSLYTRTTTQGDVWYGQWWANGRRVNRKIGLKRPEGSKEGITQKQAERDLQRLIQETHVEPKVGERLNIADTAGRYQRHAQRKGRKRSTLQDIESHVRVHIQPFFGTKSIDAITPEDVQDFVHVLERTLAPKTIRNIVATLSAIFNYARAPKNKWATANPCEGVDLPAPASSDEIRFLTLPEVDALIRHARPRDHRQAVDLQDLDRVLYLTAAMTGLRLGELVALRWQDVDWPMSKIRVRQNYVRGEFGTPKSKRSFRFVPMADEVAGALDRHYKASGHQADTDLVFANPATGEPLAKGKITARFKKSLEAAGILEHVFHDLRHTFGTHMAAAGVPMRTLQEWMGHRDIATTLIYADYSPSSRDAELVADAFSRSGSDSGSDLSESHITSQHRNGRPEPKGAQ